jgi:cytochrome c5
MNGKLLFGGIVLLSAMGALTITAQDKSAPAPKAHARNAGANQLSKDGEQDEGQRIFQRQCSSCHNAPEGFSPRISGTVVRHMRVRANLSQHEEEALLRFFNP